MVGAASTPARQASRPGRSCGRGIRCSPPIDFKGSCSMPAREQPLHELIPLLENLVSVLLAREHKSAELTALLIWMNSHCNACGRPLTAENQPNPKDPYCDTCI